MRRWRGRPACLRHGFLCEERALPGDHRSLVPRQSTLRVLATSLPNFMKLTKLRSIVLPLQSSIWLRDNDKQLVNYTDTARTKAWRRHLARSNTFSSGHEARCGTKLLETDMHRVSNRGSFGRGGRVYASFQNVKKTTRKKDVTIDGNPTRELDYKSHHPNLLYLQRGLRLDGDPYDIPGFDRDEIVKPAFNILINAMTLNVARWAIACMFDPPPKREGRPALAGRSTDPRRRLLQRPIGSSH